MQAIIGESGRRWVYKVQAGPTCEPEFYLNAHSPLLPAASILLRTSAQACLLLEYLDFPHLDQRLITPETIAHIGKNISLAIQQIQGNLPAMLDLRRLTAWEMLVQRVLKGLRSLLDQGVFTHIALQDLERLQDWVDSPSMTNLLQGESGYLHTDLSAGNIFITPNGYRVIDWQRPIWGPAGLDPARLSLSFGMELFPNPCADLSDFLDIDWFVQCALQWFPPGVKTYDKQCSDRLKRIFSRQFNAR